MADPQTVIEGTLKYRDNKKWKPRWCVIRKLSPVADCLHLQLYRDSKDRCKNGPTKASLSLEGFLGMETGFTLDKESNTMALICSEVVVVLAFDSRELLIQWQVKVRANLVEEHQFLVQIAHVPAKSKLASGPARLHLLDYMFCLTAGVPPKLLGVWPLRELRRFGVVDGKFCFEGGSRCGKGEGLHVLLTNQAKDLVQAFDMASRGRLPGKRKVSVRKNSSGVDGNNRTSLTGGGARTIGGTAENEKLNSETCSSESSTKPLLSSGSDGSDNTKGTRPCHFHYRWPSCIVPCGAARSELIGEDGARTVARSTVSGHGRTSDGQMLWAVGHCQGCGVHYCRRGTGSDKENTAPASSEDQTGFTPQWTMDLGIVSPSKDGGTTPGVVQTRTCSRNRTKASPHDRSSLCSQSSQSSGTSTGSSSSGTSSSMSEYSVPKNCLEAFYDRPKNVHHQNTSSSTLPYNRLSMSEDKDRLGPIREGGPCSCWKQQKGPDATPHELLLLGGGLLCSCWSGKGPNADVDMPSVSSSGSSNASPSTSPKKQLPLVSVPILLPCTCGKSTSGNPYLNYAVPRSGAPVKAPSDGSSEKVTTSSSESGDSQEAKIINRMDNANITTDEKEDNGNVRSGSTSGKNPTAQPGTFSQPKVCPCQRLLLCPGSLLPSFNQSLSAESARRSGGRNSSEYGSVNTKATTPSSSAEGDGTKRRADHNLNCRCRQPPVVCPVGPPDCCCGRIAFGVPFLNTFGTRLGRKDNANHIYVNLKYLQETAAAAMTSQGVPGKLIPYYANLHFLQTLSLYENANILDVRPSHLIPNVLPDGTIPEGNEKSSLEEVPKKPKKKIDTPPSNGVYEMMSFNQTEFPSTSSDNYLLMQPGTSDGRGELIAADVPSISSVPQQSSVASAPAPTGASSTSSCDPIPEGDVTTSSEASTILPLRPFMPVLLPFHEHTCEMKDNAECDESCKSSCGGRKCGECQNRSSRSSSLGDIKVSTLRRGRSSSTDGRQEGGSEDGSTGQASSCGTNSPKSTPIRKHPILTKLTLRSKEKSFSTDEITPPSSAPSSPDSLFLESIQKYPFHRSADCLQLNEEYRLSEEDLSQDPEVIMSQSMDKGSCRTPLSIKRSSSVPCKTNASNQQQGQHHSTSSTDSGISTHLPANHTNQGAIFSHFIAYHGSLPRRHSGNAASRHPVPDRKFSGSGSKSHSIQQEQKQDQSKMIFISECKQCHQFVTSPEGVLVLDAKSMTSSSSSDMSDYIESLSLCSRSSSGSGSSGCGGVGGSEYIRTDDLCNALMKIPTSCTSSLRPRSGKEYHTFDRLLIQDGCPYIPLADCAHLNLSCLKPFADDTEQQEQTDESVNANINSSSESTNNNINNNNNANKTNSPSPGYVSSSPGNADFLSSPEKTSQFTFPKETTKELNYLEVVSVGESEPSSPIVKQGAVQYAVIDVVATNAARKLSTERAQLRNEGKSPTPTECSPKHSSLEDTSANDKK